MTLETIYLKDGGKFSEYLTEWAETKGIETVSYEFKPGEDQAPQGLLLVNENQDIRRDINEVYTAFDRKHIPIQKIDINGTLQVAINSFRIWLDKNKCSSVLIVGGDDLVKNENLERFFTNLK